jgi:hypothetical protein
MGFSTTTKREILILVNKQNQNSFETNLRELEIKKVEEKTVDSRMFKQWQRKVA